MAKEKKIGRNSVLMPAADLGTRPIDIFTQGNPNFVPERSISHDRMTESTPFKQSSNTDISDLSQEQLNKFYLSDDDSKLINEIEANDDGMFSKLTKGLSKFAFKTGTAVLGGTAGTVYGGVNAIINGEFSKFYDNDFNKWLDDKNKWIDTALPIYENAEAQKNEWYEKMIPFTNGSAKFWFDDVAGGLSFTAGAVITEWLSAGLASGGVAAQAGSLFNKALSLERTIGATTKATNVLKNINRIENIKDAAGFTRQLITGAGYEAGVEARQTKEEIINDLKAKYKNKNGVDIDENSAEYHNMVTDANKAANAVFAGNMAILNIGNAIALPKTFGKLSSSLDNVVEKFSSPVAKVANLSEKTLERTASNLGKTVDELKELDFISKWDTYSKLTKNAIKVGKALESPLAEGVFEEGQQGTISDMAKLYVSKKYDTSGHDANYSLTQAYVDAFKKTYGTSEGVKEIAIGMIIGALGLPHVGKNEAGQRSMGWEGGIYGGIKGISSETEENNKLAELMNNNKAMVSTKALWQAAARSAADGKNLSPEFYEAKNKEYEDFFNFVHSRYKGGYMSSIKEDLTDNISKMDAQAFGETFGYKNLTNDELEKRKKEVISKTLEKSKNIKSAIETAEKMNKTGDDDVTEGLAYSISMLKDVDNREQELYSSINDKLGLNLSKEDIKNISKLNSKIINNVNKASLVKLIKQFEPANFEKEKNDNSFFEKKYKEYREIFKQANEEIESIEKDKFNKLYNYNFEHYKNIINNRVSISQKLRELQSSNPDVYYKINSELEDMSKLNDRRQDFIKSFNNLYTKEGQESFKSDVDDFKMFSMAFLSEDITKESATLAYYKNLGKSKIEALQGTTQSARQSQVNRISQTQQTQPVQQPAPVQLQVQPQRVGLTQASQQAAQPVIDVNELAERVMNGERFDDVTSGLNDQTKQNVRNELLRLKKKTVAPVQKPQSTEAFEVNGFTVEGMDSSYFDTTSDEELQDNPFFNTEEDDVSAEDYNDLKNALISFTEGDDSLLKNYDKDYTENVDIQKTLAPMIKKVAQDIESKNPNIEPKQLIEKMLDVMVNKFGIGEKQYNLLRNLTNSLIGKNKDANSFNVSYHEFINTIKNESSVLDAETGDLANQKNPSKNIKEEKKQIKEDAENVIQYNHKKNVIPQLSLAYLSHNYVEKDGEIETTEGNDKNKSLLSLKMFSNPANITGQLTLDLDNSYKGNTDILDHPIKIKLKDTKYNRDETVYLHTPEWFVQIKDSAGNKVLSNDDLIELVDLALSNDLKTLEKKLRLFSHNNIELFRNVAFETYTDFANAFIDLVSFRNEVVQSEVKDYDIKIASISNGKISWLKDYESATTALPEKNVRFAIVDSNKILKTSVNNLVDTDLRNDSVKPGEVVSILKLKGGKTIAVPTRLKKVSNKEKEIFKAAVNEFLSDKPISVKIKSNTLDLKDSKSLKKLLSIYVSHIPNFTLFNFNSGSIDQSLLGKILIDFADKRGPFKQAVQIMMVNRIYTEDGKIGTLFVRNQADLNKTVEQLAKEQKLILKTTNNDISGKFSNITVGELLDSYIDNKYTSIEAEINGEQLIEDDFTKTEIPKLEVENGRLKVSSEKLNYTEHVKDRLLTNINGKNKISQPNEEEEYSYVEQPVFTMSQFPNLEKKKENEIFSSIEKDSELEEREIEILLEQGAAELEKEKQLKQKFNRFKKNQFTIVTFKDNTTDTLTVSFNMIDENNSILLGSGNQASLSTIKSLYNPQTKELLNFEEKENKKEETLPKIKIEDDSDIFFDDNLIITDSNKKRIEEKTDECQ